MLPEIILFKIFLFNLNPQGQNKYKGSQHFGTQSVLQMKLNPPKYYSLTIFIHINKYKNLFAN